MSKVGTKHATLSFADPVRYLYNFGECQPMSEQDEVLAEEYLVRVWSGVRSTNAKSFDQLRFEFYTCYSQGIDSLPPTSSVIKSHIQRAAFLLKSKCSIIGVNLASGCDEPLYHGWQSNFGTLIPTKEMLPLPDTIQSPAIVE